MRITASEPAGPMPAWFRVGPYEVLRPLVRAPGAFFAEARGPNQETVLLQMTPMRAVHGDSDAAARQNLEQFLAQKTAALFQDQDMVVMAHGGATREDGARVLFWAMPWRPEAERLGNAPLYVEGAEHLLVLCLSLARRVARRHVLGGHEPLLTEHVVAVQSTRADLIAVPVAVPSAWLAPEAPTPRWAPEERETGEPCRSGDLWRLGHTMGALASAFDTVPQGLDRVVRKLTEREPAARPPRATEIVVELEAIHAALSKGLPMVPLEGTPTISMQTLSLDTLSALMQAALGHTTCEMAPEPALLLEPRVDAPVEVTLDDSAEPTIQDLPMVRIAEAPAPQLADTLMLDRVPPWAFFFTLDQLRSFLRLTAADLERRELAYVFGTGAVQLALPPQDTSYTLDLVALAHACHGTPASEWGLVVRRGLDGLLETTIPRARPPSPAVAARTEPAEGVAGPTLVLPVLAPSRARSPVPRPAPFRAPTPPRTARLVSRWLDGGRAQRLYVLGGLAALFLFGVILVGARTLNAGTWRTQTISIHDQVELRTEPSTALIVAERDGRVLGSAPQRFLVGPQASAVVLVTAPGYEPQRVTLPAQGQIQVRLVPLGEAVKSCALDLPDADIGAFEAVGATFEGSGRLVVKGAAVVRARRDSGITGAWLVRCGAGLVDLRRDPLPRVMVRLRGLPGAELAAEGGYRPAASALAVEGAFTRMRIAGQERWIPSTASVDLTNEP